MSAPLLKIIDVSLFERPVELRLPFKFGADAVTSAVQAFVRVEIELENGERSVGASAELMVPKWFDKRPHLSQDDNTDQLRLSLHGAADAYTGTDKMATAFDHAMDVYETVSVNFDPDDIPPLAAGFGPAVLEKAVIDALGRALGKSFQDMVKENTLGIDATRVAPDLGEFNMDGFLGSLLPLDEVSVRHTIGGLDLLSGDEGPDDGLPTNVDEIISAYGVRYFKIKLGGDPAADIKRCAEIASHLDERIDGDYFITLDANEQYGSVVDLQVFMNGLEGAAFKRFTSSILYIEQPFHRDNAFAVDLGGFSAAPVIIDESDGAYDSFRKAKTCGYRGVSSKSCKGVYRAIINGARARHWTDNGDGDYFMAGEDLTCQAGLAVQQDLALLSTLGINHSERNGHHFATGMAGAPVEEADDFVKHHPDMYEKSDDNLRLIIRDGKIKTNSLFTAGFASGTHPHFETMKQMKKPTKENYHG